MDLKKIVTKVRLQFVLNLIALSIVSSLNSAKAYAEGLVNALSADDIAFSNASFEATNVEDALIELATQNANSDVTFEELSTPTTGKLKTYRFTKGTGAGAQVMDIDIEKDKMRAIVGFVTITEGTGADAGKYFDGATEVGAADGVTHAGVYLKSNEIDASGAATGIVKYADAGAVIEYLTVGTQTGKMVTLTIDQNNHTITADIADGTLTKAKMAQGVQDSLDLADSAYQLPNSGMPKTDLAQGVQDSLDLADSALQSSDFDEITESECTSAWEAAMYAAEHPTQSGTGE